MWFKIKIHHYFKDNTRRMRAAKLETDGKFLLCSLANQKNPSPFSGVGQKEK